MMKPILFNAEMVRAILDGRKTVTRRSVKPQQIIGLGCDKCPNNLPEEYIEQKMMLFKPWCDMEDNELIDAIYKPPYRPGDILYVRETIWQKTGHYLDANGETKTIYCNEFKYFASDEKPEVGWNYSWATRPSIHMPKEAARIFLKVTNVRVERLHDMKDEDCEKEGLENFCRKCSALFSNCDTCLNDGGIKEDFKELWNSTIKKSDLDIYGWEANPCVWVIEFERCEKPEV